MPHYFTRLLAFTLLMAVLTGSVSYAQLDSNPPQRKLYLPMIAGAPEARNPFGFDLRFYTNDAALQYIEDLSPAKPRWVRAGEVRWADIEPERGKGYQWDKMKHLEANVRRLRERGIEPVMIIQKTPAWAQSVPGRQCGPPKPEFVGDFAKFTEALAKRYAQGPTAVHYWEIWNEPDVRPSDTQDNQGNGCWADESKPGFGGQFYGEVLKRIYPGMKRANPNAVILAGALLYDWPDDRVSQTFLRGMLDAGAGRSFDILSFHAYGEWGAGDLLVNKTYRLRKILADYGLANKPLFATEIAAICRTADRSSCPRGFNHWSRYSQANYAARIYAQAIALELEGALWYTLAMHNPGFRYSHLIDNVDGKLQPRPAYHAFRNSALLLQGAHYVGPPLDQLPLDDPSQVQVLQFRKNRNILGTGGSTLYVIWAMGVYYPDPPLGYTLNVPRGTQAVCATHLDYEQPQVFYCSDTNKDGKIQLAVNGLPRYIEVFDVVDR